MTTTTSDTATGPDLFAAALGVMPQVIAVRRRIHRHPELGLNLPETQETIVDELDRLGLGPRKGQGLSSVTAVIGADRPGRTIVLRADMDALPLHEDTGLEFTSEIDVWRNLVASVNYTFTDTKDLVTGDPLPRVPKHALNIGLTWEPIRRLSLFAQLYFRSRVGGPDADYYWKVLAAERVLRLWRHDRAALRNEARLQAKKNSSEEVLHALAAEYRFHLLEHGAQAIRRGTVRGHPERALDAVHRLEPIGDHRPAAFLHAAFQFARRALAIVLEICKRPLVAFLELGQLRLRVTLRRRLGRALRRRALLTRPALPIVGAVLAADAAR